MTLVEIVGNQYVRNLLLEQEMQRLGSRNQELEAQIQDHENFGPTKIAEALMAQNMLDVPCVDAVSVISAALKTPGPPVFGPRDEATLMRSNTEGAVK